MANSRLSSRASFLAEVDVLTVGGSLPRRVCGENLSESGMFLAAPSCFRSGDRLSLRFDVHGAEVHVRAAEVVWVRDKDCSPIGGLPSGIGVRFLSVDLEARRAIRRYVQTHLALREAGAALVSSSFPVTIEDRTAPASLALRNEEVLVHSIEDQQDGTYGVTDIEHPLAGWQFALLRDTTPLTDTSTSPSASPSPSPSRVPPPPPEDTEENVLTAVSLPPIDWTGPASLPPAQGACVAVEGHAPSSGSPSLHALVEPAAIPLPAPLHALDEDSDPGLPSLKLSFDDTSGSAPILQWQDDVAVPPSGGWRFDGLVAPEAPAGASILRHPQVSIEPPTQEPFERSGQVPAWLAQGQVEGAFRSGQLSVLELPRAEGRDAEPRASSHWRLATAAGLLLFGGSLGLTIAETSEERADEVAMAISLPQVTTEPRSVADVEVALPRPSSSREGASAESTALPGAAKPSRDEDVTAPARASVRAEPAAATALTSAVFAAEAPGASGRQLTIDRGRVVIPLRGGKVTRSFGLASPARVVVDLLDAELGGRKPDDVRQNGIARIRYGRPDPQHVRVVVELEGGQAPTGISTAKDNGALTIRWR